MLLLRLVTLLLLWPLIALAAHAQPADDRPVLILAADAWCPFNCAPNAAQPGYLVEFAAQVATANGYRLDYRQMPWSQALALTHSGKVQGVIGASPVYAGELVLTSEIAGLDITAIAIRQPLLKKTPITALNELDGWRLGFIQHYVFDNGGSVDRYVLERRLNAPATVVQVNSANGLQELLALLQQQRIDFIFENEAVLRYALQQQPTPVAISATGSVSPLHYGFTANDDGRGWAALFDAALQQAQQDGSLARLMAKYGLPPLPPQPR